MGCQKFCSCSIFFDEPFTRGLIVNGGPLRRRIRASYLYVKCIFMRDISRAISLLGSQALIVTDFLGYFVICMQKQK